MKINITLDITDEMRTNIAASNDGWESYAASYGKRKRRRMATRDECVAFIHAAVNGHHDEIMDDVGQWGEMAEESRMLHGEDDE